MATGLGYGLVRTSQPTSDVDLAIARSFRYNAVVTLLNGSFWTFSASFIGRQTILPLYVSHLTDSRFLLGLLSAISTAGWFLPQIFTANWVQRLPRKKAAPVRVGLFTERLPVFLMVPGALLATRAPGLALAVFFVLFAWHVLGNGVVGVGFHAMLAKILPVERRGRVMGATQFVGAAGGVLSTLVAGRLLDRYDFPDGYMLCFAAAAGLTLVSWIWLALVREPAQISGKPAASSREYWSRLARILRDDSRFRRYLLSRFVVNIAGMATGFLAVYAAQRWHLPDHQTATFATSMLVGQALCNLLFGFLADRRGHKLVLELAVLCVILAVGLALAGPGPAWFHAVFALVGGGAAGLRLSGAIITFEFSSPATRPAYIGLNNTIAGISAALAPLLGGLLADAVGFQALLAVALGAGVLGFGLFRWLVSEPRHAGSLS